jgi:predicted nuclease with TOPRIM domain
MAFIIISTQNFETRLQEENRNLLKEKTHLKDLMGNLQSIQAELEKSVEGEKRRLENQVKALEGQTYVIHISSIDRMSKPVLH